MIRIASSGSPSRSSPRSRRRGVAARAAPRGARRLRRAGHRGARGRPRRPASVVYAHNANAALLPASNEKLAAHLRRARRARAVVPDAHRGARRGPLQDGQRLARQPGPEGLRRSDARPRRPRRLARDVCARPGSAASPAALVADESWFDARRGGPGWKAVVRPRGVAAALGAGRRRRRAASGTPRLFREALARGRRPRHGRHEASHAPAAGRWPSASRRRSRRSSTAWTSRATTSPAELVLKQLGAVARARRDDRRRCRGRPRDPRRADDPARRRPDRRRLRPVGARPHDPEGARDDPSACLGRPGPPLGAVPDPPRRGPRRDARGPDDAARPRAATSGRRRARSTTRRRSPASSATATRSRSSSTRRGCRPTRHGPRRTGSRRC